MQQYQLQLEISDYPYFPFHGRRVSNLILNNNLTSLKLKTIYVVDFTRKQEKKNSLIHCFRLLKNEQAELQSPIHTEKQIQSRKFINLKPLKNAIEKITKMRQEQQPRRKSAYGDFFGEMTNKQLQNYPTTIENHKQIDTQRFALTSFADILERKKQKRTTRKTILLRKLSKQDTIVEYDHMERPPSCKTPPKQIILKQQSKSKIELIKDIYLKLQDSKMIHFLAGKNAKIKEFQSRKKAHTFNLQTTTLQSFSIIANKRNSLLFPNLPINKISRCITNSYENKFGPLSSRSVQSQDRPYVKYNKILSKQIQSEIKHVSGAFQKFSYQI